MANRGATKAACLVAALRFACSTAGPAGSEDGDDGMMGIPMGFPFPLGMMSAGGGMPIRIRMRPMVMRFGGHDALEDLHNSVVGAIENRRDEAEASGAVARPGAPHPMMGLGDDIGSLMAMLAGDHAGHFGKSEGAFEVDDKNKTHLRISAVLPDYKFSLTEQTLDHAAESPLSVRAVGHSLVVKGMQQSGPVIRSWQRVFSLPLNSDLDHIQVRYQSQSGNLTIEVPRTEGMPEKVAEDEDDDGDEMLPPMLQLMKDVLPELLGQLEGDMSAHGVKSLRGKKGPAAHKMLDNLLEDVNGLHPRNQLHEDAESPPEDADLHFLGCFDEEQLGKAELKYYGKSNAASFNGMYWHASDDAVSFFAMARQRSETGHAFTVRGLAHEKEKPKWGIYDGCGSRCADDDARWCGCVGEGGEDANPACAPGEKRFAVYRRGALPASAHQDSDTDEAAASEGGGEASPSSDAKRPFWQLKEATAEGQQPSIEVAVPAGMTAKAKGRQVLLFSADDQDGPTAGKIKLPVDVDEASCELLETESKKGKILRCLLDEGKVRELPIRVVDEL